MIVRPPLPLAMVAIITLMLPNGSSQTTARHVTNLSETSFDTTLEKLPAGFTGNSIAAVFQAIAHQSGLQKSEFESSAEYKDRLASQPQSRLLGNLRLDGTLAFVIQCDAEASENCNRYDAETKTMNVLLPFDSASPGRLADSERLNPTPRSVQILEQSGPRTTAGMAQNGFGARFPVSKQSITRYFLETTVPDWFNRAAQNLTGELNPFVPVIMNGTTAIQAKGHVKELIIGHLSAPFLGQVGDRNSEATTSYPVRATVHVRGIHLNIDEVWFFNQKSGEVYRKLRPSSEAPTSETSGETHPAIQTPLQPKPQTRTARVAADVMEKQVLDHPMPTYPPIARAAHVSGTVKIYVVIAEDGRVKDARVISGPPMLTSAALNAVLQWRYKPYLVEGEPAEVSTTISLTFSS